MREFEDVLNELTVKSPHEIYETLKLAGVKGHQADGGNCPIANYIKWETGAWTIHVGTHIVLHYLPGLRSPFDGPKAPPSVRSFVQGFDDGTSFQDLNEEKA